VQWNDELPQRGRSASVILCDSCARTTFESASSLFRERGFANVSPNDVAEAVQSAEPDPASPVDVSVGISGWRGRECFQLVEGGSVAVFIGENRFTLRRPVHSDGFVIPEQRAFVLRGVAVGAFVDEVGGFAEDYETVCEAGRDPELSFVLGGKLDAEPLTERWRVLPHIHGDVKDFALHDMDEFSLRLLNLKMQTSQRAAARVRPVVLDERSGDADFGVPLRRECFEKEAS
jgi:hypothetical protein